MYPYGEPDNDWLGIDKDVAKRKGVVNTILKEVSEGLVGVEPGRALLHHPSNRNLFGYVKIDGEVTKNFDIQMNREGFIYTESITKLIEILRLSLEWSTIHYAHFVHITREGKLKEEEIKLREELKRIRDEKKELKENREGTSKLKEKIDGEKNQEDTKFFEEISGRKELAQKALNILESESKRSLDFLEKEDKKGTERRIKLAKDYLEASFEFTDEEIDHLRTVASTGALIMAYSHEIRGLVHGLDRHSKTLQRISKKLPKTQRKELKKLSESLDTTKARFRQQLKLFGLLAKGTDEEKKEILVKEAIHEVIEGFTFLTDYFGLSFDIKEIDEVFTVGPLYEAEFYSIIVNLISNAVKAAIGGEASLIQVQAEKAHKKKHIRFSNDGVRLSKRFWKKVFEPWFADPENVLYQNLSKKIEDQDLISLGKGSGLGLSIVKGIVEKNGGTVQFIKPKDPYKTCVEVVLP